MAGWVEQEKAVSACACLQNPRMAVATLYLPKHWCAPKIPIRSNSRSCTRASGKLLRMVKPETIAKAGAVGVGVFRLLSLNLSFVEPALSLQVPLQLHEPLNALSLPTWAIHVSSVLEWIIAMALVWQYGDKSGYESWKGLSWGMLPLLGGALCACTWHFFYNSESLEVLVALQAALTVIGNATMCIAAYRIYKSSSESSKNF